MCFFSIRKFGPTESEIVRKNDVDIACVQKTQSKLELLQGDGRHKKPRWQQLQLHICSPRGYASAMTPLPSANGDKTSCAPGGLI